MSKISVWLGIVNVYASEAPVDNIYNPQVDPSTMVSGANMTNIAVIGVLAIVIFSALGFVFKNGTGKQSAGQIKAKKQQSLNKKYRFLATNFITKAGFIKLVNQLTDLSILSAEEIRAFAVSTYIKSNLIMLSISLAGIFMFKDILSILLTIIYGYCIKTVRMEKAIDKIHVKLIHQLKSAIANMRQGFIKTNSITDTLEQIELGNLLERPFAEIYDILTGEDSANKLDIFFEKTQFKMLQTLANVCYVINKAGDAKNDRGGSVFVESLSMLGSEINLEIRKLHLQKAKFGSLEIMPLIPLFGAELLAGYLQGVIPGTIVVYRGLIGYLARIGIIVSSIVGYTVIARANSVVSIKVDDRDFNILGLLKNKKIFNMVDNICPKKIKTARFYNNLFKNAMSMQSVHHIFLKKVIFAAFIFLATFVLGISSIFLAKDFVYNNLQETSLVAGSNTDAAFYLKRKTLDDEYMKLPLIVMSDIEKKDSKYSIMCMRETETLDLVKTYFPDMADYDLQLEVERVMSKYSSYNNMGWKWWITLIALALGGIGWKIPNIQLKYRARQIKAESEEDILQLQTLIAILMHTPIDTMDMVYWLGKQSKVYRDVLYDAYNEYASDPELALNRLKARVNMEEFSRIIDKLILTIHQVDMPDAFGDLVTERAHLLQTRETVQISTIEKKRVMLSPLAQLPLGLVVVTYVLVPIAILGAKEFAKAMSSMNSM